MGWIWGVPSIFRNFQGFFPSLDIYSPVYTSLGSPSVFLLDSVADARGISVAFPSCTNVDAISARAHSQEGEDGGVFNMTLLTHR